MYTINKRQMNKRLSLFLFAFLVMIAACKKTDLGSAARPVSLTLSIQYDEEHASLSLPKKDAVIKITNLTSGDVKEGKTAEDGTFTFPSITPGSYTITASITIPAAVYSTQTSTAVDEDVVFNANLTAQPVTNEFTTLTLPLTAGQVGDWVFKQIYYGGSNTSTGASFRDQFYELYNNSNKTLYADSLYIAQIYGSNSTAKNYPANGYLPNNQYDWTKAIGMTATDANEKYVYTRSLVMIPGNGTSHPVAPGQSIIIAQTGLNHTAPYVLNDGQSQGITNPDLTVDLSGADFEGYLVDYKRAQADDPASFSAYKWDIDNPAVKNLDILFVASGNEYLLDNLGREALVVMKPTGIDPRQWPAYPVSTATAITSSTTRYPQIPISLVIDAVELQRDVETQRVPKRLTNSLDAGPTHASGGAYSSQSLVRKTVRIVNGVRKLQDTNNSANDFFTKAKADPSKSDASFNP